MNDATEIVELLLKNGANVSGRNRDGSTALSTANLEITALLLQYGAKVSDELGVQAPSCLHYAASLGQTERLRLLLSERADGRSCLLWLDPEGKTPLGCGVEAGEVEVVKLLLNSGAEIDDNELTVDFNRPLALAADYGHQHVLELLEAWKTAKGK
ncbi:MAG: ankyrin repeat domain-containing protein [Candidatus Eremiobacteraeota bacterium]|nr:ankyrin repeat domain-containing protein [Candidatus Eremiobacteraeota bacterium]